MEDEKSLLKEQWLSTQENEQDKRSLKGKTPGTNSTLSDGKGEAIKLRKQVNQNTIEIKDI